MDNVLVFVALVVLILLLAYESGKHEQRVKQYEKTEKDILEARKALNTLSDNDARNELREKFYRD